MKFHVNDAVELIEAWPEEHLEKGAIGVVVEKFIAPVEAYEIEFCDENGVMIAQISVTPDKIVKVEF